MVRDDLCNSWVWLKCDLFTENARRYLEEAQRQLDLLDRDCLEKEHLYNCTQDLAVIDKQIDELRGQV